MAFLSYVQKYKMLLFHPTEFFNSVQAENRYWPILLFVAVPVSITYALNVFISMPYFGQYGENKALISILQIIGFTIGMFVMLFISSGITHVGVKVVHGKNDFFNTFKPVTYTGGLIVFYQIIGGIISFIMTKYLQLDALTIQRMVLEQQSFFSSPFLPYMIVGGIIGIIQFIHLTFVEVIGVAHFQNISRGKALLAVLVIPLALLLGLMFGLALVFVIIWLVVGVLFSN